MDFGSVQHLAVIVKIVHSRLPRQILGLLRQEGGGSQSKSRGDQLSPAQKESHSLPESWNIFKTRNMTLDYLKKNGFECVDSDFENTPKY